MSMWMFVCFLPGQLVIKESSFLLNQDGIFVPSSCLCISESIMQLSQPYLGKQYKRVISTFNSGDEVILSTFSTSKGLMTDKEAREAGLGGEVLAYIW